MLSEVEQLARHLDCGWVVLGLALVHPTDVQADLGTGNHLGLFIILLKLLLAIFPVPGGLHCLSKKAFTLWEYYFCGVI